jgi:chromosomal replication initiator protein
MTAALNPHARFDTLVVGAANRLAVTAAKAVAESPGAVYNPLFVYAKPGLGKTHLLMAIGHGAQAINPGLAVEYLTLDNFVEAFHAAIASGQGEAYRKRFLEVDLLLVDDVQFLTNQRETQAELLRIIDGMQTASRQIVLTSDRPPAEIEALDERLIRRFAGGLVIDIAVPDYETRVAILRRKAEERRVVLAPGVLEAVAKLGIDNVRELVGALNRLAAHQAVSERPLAATQVAELLGMSAVPRASPHAAATGNGAPPSDAPSNDAPGQLADEFGDFLSEVSAAVSQQIEAWRGKIGAAILRWEGEGYQVRRLAVLLEQEISQDPEQALRAFEADARRLEELRTEAAGIAADLAGSPVFRDPDDVPAAEALVQQAREGAHPPPGPSAQWGLEALIEDQGNRVALQAARAVAAHPGTKYNPLVIVGASGVGKTHLLHAIGNLLVAQGLGVVACLSAEEFTGELIEAIDRDAVSKWRSRFRRIDAFLLDDVQLVAEKDRSQEELFFLFNLFLESSRQMVFTSAVPLPELRGLEPRLRTRLEGGLVVDLPPPDREVRQRIVERLVNEAGDMADPDVAPYLAGRPAESVRNLQGLFQRVASAAEAGQTRLTAAFARSVLEGAPTRAPRRSNGVRASGIVAPGAAGLKSREKTVWEWPDIADRLLEDWR